jgi:hypothetical protein
MKKILYILLVIAAGTVWTSCTNGKEQKNESSVTGNTMEINKENAARDKGDHVTESDEIPPLTEEQKQAYMKEAKQIAKTAYDIFSGHLKRLFAEKKPGEALEYCKNNALKITDSLSRAHHVKIKRTSYRLRNPENKPSDQEEKIMEIFKQRIHKNVKSSPYLHYDTEGNVHVYIPIIVQEKCLMCHGDPNKDIPQEINEKLAELYPNDKAIFFKKGDLRGIWSIQFPKKQQK